jgi:septal ring factor EnvC (AmiA/AmiB activator)
MSLSYAIEQLEKAPLPKMPELSISEPLPSEVKTLFGGLSKTKFLPFLEQLNNKSKELKNLQDLYTTQSKKLKESETELTTLNTNFLETEKVKSAVKSTKNNLGLQIKNLEKNKGREM